MARKTMAAARKRRSPTVEQHQLATMPAALLEASPSAPASVDPSSVSYLPSAQYISFPLDVPSSSHAHDYKRRAHHLEMVKKVVCWSMSDAVERSNLDMVMDACLNTSETSSYKRKQSCVGSVSRKATNMATSLRKGAAYVDQAEYAIECAKNNKSQPRDKFGMDLEMPAVLDVCTTPKMSTRELESWIVKHSMLSNRREHEILFKSKDGEKIDKSCLELSTEKHIEIEVDLSQGHGFLFEHRVAATDHMPNMVSVEGITGTISLNRVSLDGQDEVIILFKALRSDGAEIIVDNMYLRAVYPLLLATFYEQHLCFLVGNSSGKAQGQCFWEEIPEKVTGKPF